MAEERAKRKLSAILSADVKGYSRLMGEDELATIETLKNYREIMATLIDKFQGRVVDSPGDNVLAEFSSVVDALECSVEIQKELKQKNEQLPGNRRMEFRIGVNLGDVVEDGERIYGDGVNIAARVESLAEGGGICISGTAFDQIGKKLPLGYEYLGEQTVKNIEKPVRVYRVLMEPEAAGEVIGQEGPRPRPWRYAVMAAVVATILVAAALTVWNFYFRAPRVEPASVERMAYPLSDKPSIAVLPFDNLSGDPNQDYLSDGITEEIITSLSKVPQLFVIARNSAFTYKGKPVKVQKVAEDLGVRYVLEGSVRKSEDRIRITAQLVDAIKGYHLWAERYDRDFNDLFALQDEITMKISSALRLKLTEGERARSYAKGAKNLRAYEKLLQARELHLRFDKNANIMARKVCEEAITLDPGYAQAYGLLGNIHLMDNILGISKNPRESLKRAYELEKKALSLDDTLAGPHRVLSFIYAFKKQHDKSVEHAEKAVALEPGSATSHGNLGRSLAYAGRYNEAIEALEKAIRMDPFPENWYFIHLSDPYINVGRYEEALAVVKRGLDLSPNIRPFLQRLVIIYSLTGRDEEASAVAENLIKLHPKFTIEGWAKRVAFKDQAVIERYVKAMRKAGLPETPPLPLPDKPSIGVLPFTNMSEDPKQEYFSDGITEEIITALSKTPKLFVIARHSTFTYKGKPVKVKQIGRELGVQYVLEGSVRKAAERVRITAQLIDATTEKHLWAERYDRDLKDLFALQDEIAMKIITALRVKLTEGEQARLIGKGTDNLEAYLKCLQARELNEGAIAKEKCVLARRLLEEAIALDPKYSEAYAVLAQTHSIEVWLGMSKSPREHLKHGVELAQKAIALANSNAHAHSILAALYVMLRQHDKGLAAIERAYALEPNSPDVLFRYGNILYRVGRWEEAVRFYEEAMRLNPIPPNMYLRYYGGALRELERYDEAIAVLKKAIQQEPKSMFAHLMLATAYSLAGREEEAREEAKEVLRINPRFSVRHLEKTLTFKNPAHTQRLIDAMRKAGLPD